MTTAAQLTDKQASEALTLFIQKWADSRGLEVVAVWQDLEAGSLKSGGAAAAANLIGDDPVLARRILDAIAEGDQEEVAVWARDAIEQAARPKAHVVDPVSLGIVGATLICLVLAARVKKVGSAEFFKGVPPELAKLVKAAAKVIGGGN